MPRGAVALGGIPAGWDRRESGPWTVVTPPDHVMPEQGWKIHLAPAVPVAAATVARAIDYCVDTGLAFKMVTRLEYVWALNGKYAPREASGKTFVVYPTDEDPSITAAALTSLFEGVPGPRVLGSYRVGHSIVHLRYGSFIKRYTRDLTGEPCLAIRDQDGSLVPDLRGVTPQLPPGVDLPAVLTDADEPAKPATMSPHIYKVTGALHFSNTGGVYQAVDTSTGQDVVLKEARHHTGYDAAMDSAVDRLRRQRDAMNSLAGTGGVAPVIEYFTQGDSDFLAYGFTPGSTLQEWAAAHSPALFVSDPAQPIDRAAADTYAEDVEDLIARLERLLAAVHAEGLVLGDLHPANVVVGDDGELVLIDLEAASRVSDGPRFVGADGFFDPAARGTEIDAHGLAATRLYLYNPVVATAGYQQSALSRSIAHAQRIFHRDENWATELSIQLGVGQPVCRPSSASEEVLDTLLTSLASRLDFGKDLPLRCAPTGQEEHTRLSISWGAPGAVYALAACGALPAGLEDAYVQWIDSRRDAMGSLGNGLLDGWAGNIVVADLIGKHDLADDLLDLLLDGVDLARSPLRLRSGLAGTLALCITRYAARPGRLDIGTVEKLADAVHERATQSLASSGRPVAGLLDGASGVALALGRAYRILPKPEYVDAVRRLLAAELSTYVGHESGALLHYDDASRVLGYLDRGNAGFLLAAAELNDIATGVEPVALRRVHLGSCSRIGVAPGLYFGLAGGLAASAQLATTGLVESQSVTAAVHCQTDSVVSFVGRGLHEGGLVVPGQVAARASDDVATGAAGVALALGVACGRTHSWLAGVF
ncbi:phosphotransferase [Rhodococcus sp. ABRD24]|uniref:class III lanthionine synthetase LanKC N-terminal domain-containing protein n=1 Tax=Rhodococcus sp. ABRD24 TaxID=2507582 RepID=UPI001A955ED2|nr:phosphotransferase [Rhodococcus sp. ABRD24]